MAGGHRRLAGELGEHAVHLRLAEPPVPPGVRMEPMRPADAQRVTVFGSTRNRAATSPGVSSRSLLPVGGCGRLDGHPDSPVLGCCGINRAIVTPPDPGYSNGWVEVKGS